MRSAFLCLRAGLSASCRTPCGPIDDDTQHFVPPSAGGLGGKGCEAPDPSAGAPGSLGFLLGSQAGVAFQKGPPDNPG